MHKYRDFQLMNAIKVIKENECNIICNGFKVGEDYCKNCAYKIALDVLEDEIKREKRRK